MMQPSSVKRSARVAERVREEIATALGRDLQDPRLQDVVVTRVEMPDDLGLARVRVRLTVGGDDPVRQKRALAGLAAASGPLRKRVGQALGLRRTPELTFHYDEGQDASTRVEALLEEIRKDRSGPQ
jgi:ribosome-binding factor A